MASEAQRPPPALNGADWRTSDAKQLIVQDMLDGLVPYKEPIKDTNKLFHVMHAGRPEFKDFPCDEERHKTRFSRLQEVVRRLRWAALYDEVCLEEARELYPVPTHGPTGVPLWEGSAADSRLEEDMAEGLHLQMKPKKLFATRPEYKEFGLKRFTKRIDQKREAAKPCGENPMQTAAKREQKEKKKEKKEKARVKDRQEMSRRGEIAPHENTPAPETLPSNRSSDFTIDDVHVARRTLLGQPLDKYNAKALKDGCRKLKAAGLLPKVHGTRASNVNELIQAAQRRAGQQQN